MPTLVTIAFAIAFLAAVDRVSESDRRSIEPYAGIFQMDDGERNHDVFPRLDDQGVAPAIGVRAFPTMTDAWEIGLEYGYTSFESILRETNEPGSFSQRSDVEAHAILAQARHAWPLDRVDLFATAGAGIVIIEASALEPEPHVVFDLALSDVGASDPDPETSPALSLGVGVRRSLSRRLAATIEARDLLHRCGDSSDFYQDASRIFCDRDAWLHHLQLTAGLRVEL